VAAICLDRPHAISEIRPTLFRETAATRPHMKTREPKLVCPLPRLNLDPVPAATKPNLDRPAGQERLGGNPTLTSNNCCRAAVRTGLGGVVPVVVAGRPGLGVCGGTSVAGTVPFGGLGRFFPDRFLCRIMHRFGRVC